jgi:hypothetical protein
MRMKARTSAPATAKLNARAVRKEAVVAERASTDAALELGWRGDEIAVSLLFEEGEEKRRTT